MMPWLDPTICSLNLPRCSCPSRSRWILSGRDGRCINNPHFHSKLLVTIPYTHSQDMVSGSQENRNVPSIFIASFRLVFWRTFPPVLRSSPKLAEGNSASSRSRYHCIVEKSGKSKDVTSHENGKIWIKIFSQDTTDDFWELLRLATACLGPSQELLPSQDGMKTLLLHLRPAKNHSENAEDRWIAELHI